MFVLLSHLQESERVTGGPDVWRDWWEEMKHLQEQLCKSGTALRPLLGLCSPWSVLVHTLEMKSVHMAVFSSFREQLLTTERLRKVHASRSYFIFLSVL